MICEVGYEVGGGIFSVNMLESDDFIKCRAEAHKHAKRFGYELKYVREIPDWRAEENKRKGMPLTKIS